MKNIALHTVTAALLLLSPIQGLAAEPFAAADLQFFGDIYLSQRALEQTASTPKVPKIFDGVRGLLDTASVNIANFEGVATSAFVPRQPKRHLLQMDVDAPAYLSAAGISAVTLANNHSVDFGYQGLFDTLWSLRQNAIAPIGAGIDRDEAQKPLILQLPGRTVCVLSLSRTLPESFWATPQRPGTAFAEQTELTAHVKACVAAGHFTIAVFHWGEELSHAAQPYQRELAHLAIDAGANLIVGHHPHVAQPIELYKNRLIVYSLGNFVFSTMPSGQAPEGLALRLKFGTTAQDPVHYELVPLLVDNARVAFVPRPYSAAEEGRAAKLIPKLAACPWRPAERLWSCTL